MSRGGLWNDNAACQNIIIRCFFCVSNIKRWFLSRQKQTEKTEKVGPHFLSIHISPCPISFHPPSFWLQIILPFLTRAMAMTWTTCNHYCKIDDSKNYKKKSRGQAQNHDDSAATIHQHGVVLISGMQQQLQNPLKTWWPLRSSQQFLGIDKLWKPKTGNDGKIL